MAIPDAIPIVPWAHPDTLARIEDRIDSALSSSNGILNFLLAPVREFVGAVLHPVLWLADLTVGWVYDVGHWTFERGRDIAVGARNAVAGAIDLAWQFAGNFASDAISVARRELGDARSWAGGIVSDVYGWARREISDARDYAAGVARYGLDLAVAGINTARDAAFAFARGVEQRARDALARAFDEAMSGLDWLERHVEDVAGTLGMLVRRGIEDAIGAARALAREAVDAGHAAIDNLMRHVIDPLTGELRNFIDLEWRWAMGLLHLIEDAAHWIQWVGSRIVPDAIELWQFARHVLTDDMDDLLGIGADLATEWAS